jgi:methyltransferase of ATP-grasp peptide maturase system
MTILVDDWPVRARRLADELAAAGKLTSGAWREALCAVPRHEFVPDVFRQDRQEHHDPTWRRWDTSTDQGRQQWLDQVYSNTALITALTRTAAGTVSRSSSSMPGLMTRMLEALDVHDGHRVLEIGTGTGYNAGLLSHRLGDANVFSVDVEPDLVDVARKRLARLGYQPTLVAADGAAGLPEHAPFDRIIATCAVPAVPWAWVAQTALGGVILTDLKISLGAGSLVRLTRHPDRAEGRFDPVYAGFMRLHHEPAGQALVPPRSAIANRVAEPERRTTTVDPRTPWTSLITWFVAGFDLGDGTSLGYCRFVDGKPTAVAVTAPDGSWAEVDLVDDHGVYQVVEGGPRRAWRIIEKAHATWLRLGEPGWDRFGLTVTDEHQQVWFDSPCSDLNWRIGQEAV